MNLVLVVLFVSHAFFLGAVDCTKDKSDFSRSGGAYDTTTRDPSEKDKPGITKHTFTKHNESSWVPVISAAMIIMVVFMISLFACCIHCPFCFVYRRHEPQRIV